MKKFNEKDARKFYRFLGHRTEEYTEIRAIQWPPGDKPKRTWVQNERDFVAFCKEWNGKRQIYAGINPRFHMGGANEDVSRVIAIPLDIDSFKPSKDVAATDAELAATKERMIEVNSWIKIQGYQQPLITMSGNGFHILQRLNIPITEGLSAEELTSKLESYFFNELPSSAKIDKILDAARIIKIPGTLSIKGVPTEERPHRLSYIVNEGDPNADEALGAHIIELEPYSPTPKIYVPSTTKGKKKKRRTSRLKPCFKRFAEEGGKLSARGEDDNNLRMALVSEAHSKGYSREEIIELFSRSDDFGDGKITTYNVDRLLGKIAVEGQKVWSCRAIHKHNGCIGQICKRYAKQIAPPEKGQDSEEERDLKKESLALLGNKYVFATPDDVEILYLYQDGKYVPAKTIIQEEVEAQHGDNSSSGLCAAVIGHFKRRSYVKRSEINKFDNFMPVANGLLNLTTFKLTPHTPDKIFTFKLETAYLPGKKCPKFMKYYNETLPNKEAQQVVQEYSGYTLLPAFPHHYFLFMIGGGRNGKGTLIRTIIGILGIENVAAVPLDQLDGKHRFVVATLFGKLMNVCSEPSTKELHPQILKKVTGQDLVHGEIKNKQNPLNFIPFAKWFVLANELPPVNDTTLSFWDRLQLVEYTQSFTDEKGNKITDIELQWLNDPDERSGILNWMVAGLIRLQKQGGITQTKTMKQKKLEYKRVSDSIGAFLADENQVIYGSILFVTRKESYEAYKIFAENLGVSIESNNKFIARLRLIPNVLDRSMKIANKKERIWRGIGLVSPETREAGIPTEEKVAPGARVARLTDSSYTPINHSTPSNHSLPSSKIFDPNSKLKKGATPALRATDSALIIEEAARILKETGEVMQPVLWEKLAFKDITWEEANPILRADSQFRFMGMFVKLRGSDPDEYEPPEEGD